MSRVKGFVAGRPRLRKADWAVVTAVATALVGGQYAAHDLLSSSASKVTTAADRNGRLQALVHTGPARLTDVPFLGPFHEGQCGPAIRLMEGALRKTRPPIRTTKPSSCFGAATKRQVREFQRRHKIPRTGVYGPRTHRALAGARAYSDEARRDLIYIRHARYVVEVRHTVLIVTSHALLVGARIPYSQSPSRSYFPPWPAIPPATDCSGFVTWALYQAGVGPSVGYLGGGSPVGWTGTLVYQGSLVPRNKALQVGDLIFYPSSRAPGRPYGHVAIYIGHGRVASHGGVGIKNLPYNYRAIGEVRRYIS